MAIECTYCEEKVNAKRGVYVKCTTCQDVSLCLDCFSSGSIIAEHKSDHPYELIDCGSFSIIDESWKAHEELALLEAIELYGIGSWTDISNAVETRTAEECCERYLSVYVENFFGRCTWNAVDRNAYTVQDHTCLHNQPLSPSLSLPEKNKIVDISREQQIRLGYMPKRDDFEREYDNDAELLVSKLAVNANDDTDLDRDLKIAHINMYTDKLRERFRRKRIVLEYNLVKLFFHMHTEENSDLQDSQSSPENNHVPSIQQNVTSDTANSMNAMTPSQQISPILGDSADIKSIQDGQKDFKNSSSMNPSNSASNQKPQIQNTILNYFHRIEPNTHDNPTPNVKQKPVSNSENSILSSYFSDLNKSLAEQDFNCMEKKLRIFCQFSSAEEHNKLIRNLARERELKIKIKELIQKRKNGLKSTYATSNATTNNTNTTNGTDSESSVCKQTPSNNKRGSIKSTVQNGDEKPMDIDPIEIDEHGFTTKVSPKKNGGKNESGKQTMNISNDIGIEPSLRLLSEGEKRLCKSFNLKPSQYISLKASIMKVSKSKILKDERFHMIQFRITNTISVT